MHLPARFFLAVVLLAIPVAIAPALAQPKAAPAQSQERQFTAIQAVASSLTAANIRWNISSTVSRFFDRPTVPRIIIG